MKHYLPLLKTIIYIIFFISSYNMLYSQSVAMLTSTVEPNPWGLIGHRAAMNDVFGAGNWDDLRYENNSANSVFIATYNFVYLEGSNTSTSELLSYLSNNQTLIETWVSNGGNLMINFATNEIFGASNLGFNNVVSTRDPSHSGIIVASGHDIFLGPSTPTSGSYAGNSFSHNFITNGGITLIKDGDDHPVLTEKPFGAGRVIFGGLTISFIGESSNWTPVPNQANMIRNVLVYLELNTNPCSGDNTYLGGANGTSWLEPTSWSLGCVPVEPINVDITISSDCFIDNSNTIEFASTGTLTIEGSGTLANYGTLNLSSGASFENNGTYKGSGTFNGSFVNNGFLSPGN